MNWIRNIFVISVVGSLLFHFVIGISLLFAPDENKEEKSNIVALEFIYDESQNKADQIVDQNVKRLNDEVPEDSKFLSRHNQRVVKQTKARNNGKFKNSAAQGRAPVKEREQQAKAQSKIAKSLKAPGGLPSIQDLKPQFDWNKFENKAPKRTVQNAGDPSQSNDYLKDIEEGSQTILSTREFVYFTYYARIKSKIQQYWEPNIKAKVKKIFRQGRKIASVDRITRLLILLNNEGTLVGVKVLSESGVTDLDDAAIEAFKAAAPFPNPPTGLVEKDGTVKIRWDFILES